LTRRGSLWFPARMTNILGDDKKQQILALGRLGWPLRRIEQATGVRRETASAYLKAAGIAIRAPRRRRPPPKPASGVSTDPAKPASGVSTDPANPASQVSTDPGPLAADLTDLPVWPPPASRAPTASACEPYRELIELALGRGRNAMAIWQDLVDHHGFLARYASVRRFVGGLRGQRPPEAHPVIVTAPGEEGQSTTATGRWSGTRPPGSTGARACSSSPRATAARASGCSRSSRARGAGRNSTKKRFGAWGAPSA
jgi:hypothetical protein